MLFLHKIGLYAVAGLALSTLLFLGYNHYTGLVEEIRTLEGDLRVARTVLEVERETVRELERLAEEWRKSAEDLQLRLRDAREVERDARREIERLNDIFARHDLALLARARPGLIESRVNSGTERMFRILECETATPGRCDPDGRPETADRTAVAPATDSAAAREVGGDNTRDNP